MISETDSSPRSSSDLDDSEEEGQKSSRKLLQQVRRVLIKHPDDRAPQDLRALARYLKTIKFFKDRTKEGQKLALRDRDMELICSHLDYL